MRISDLGYELFQGFGAAKKYSDNLGKKVDGVGREVRSSRGDIRAMHQDMNKSHLIERDEKR